MINHFVNYLIKQQVITEEDAEVQTFALIFLTQTLLAHGTLFILAAVFGMFPETVLFEVIFMPLRCYAGGYHAATQIRCFILSVSVWGLIMFLVSNAPLYVGLIILPIACVLIWLIAPVPHKNNPIGPIRFAQVKRICRILVCVDTVLFLVCYTMQWKRYALLIALILLAVSISLFVAKQKEIPNKA